MKFCKNILLFLLLILSFEGYCQKGDQVKLVDAETLEGGTYKGQPVRKVKGNVLFKQKDMLLYCDSAYQYPGKNTIDAFGHVKILQGDSLTLTGNLLNYFGDTKMAYVKGNVVLKDKLMTLTTEALDYNMSTKHASYSTGGKIVDQKSILTSKSGYYNTTNKMLYFKNNVRVVNPKFTLISDTLEYNTKSKIAYFKGPSQIVTPTEVINADKGEYNTVQDATTISGRSKVESGSYVLTGDKIFYDEKAKRGIVKGNVKVTSTKDKMVIVGDVAHYWGSKGISKVFGHAIMKNVMDGDTLYLTADTLHSIDNGVKKEKRMLAYNHCKIYKSDLQGICDSLAYNFSDSTINFFRDPVLWNLKNQILADSINIQMANNKFDPLDYVTAVYANGVVLAGYQLIAGDVFVLDVFTGGGIKVNDWAYNSKSGTIFPTGPEYDLELSDGIGKKIILGFNLGFAF